MKKVLGRGLSALIPDTYVREAEAKNSPGLASAGQAPQASEAFQIISILQIAPNQDQPRREFSPEGIEELAASIKEKGVLQPVIVKKAGENRFSLICGERRLRAARLCGLSEIPAVVRDVAPDDFLEWALIENIQREDLNPIEEANAFLRLVEERRLSHEEVAKRVGKDRSTVANMIRLLRLPDEVLSFLVQGLLSSGHARALLSLLTPEHQRQLAKRIVEENLSVRQVELIVNRSNAQKRRAKKARQLDTDITDLETRLGRHLGTQVKIYPRKDRKQGRIEIHYFSLDELDGILDKIGLAKL